MDMPKQENMADEMRRAAALAREHGHEEIAQGNEAIAEYIEGLECGLAAERKLSAIRTKQRDDALAHADERAAQAEKDGWARGMSEAARLLNDIASVAEEEHDDVEAAETLAEAADKVRALAEGGGV